MKFKDSPSLNILIPRCSLSFVTKLLWSILNNWAYHKCLFVLHSSTFAFVLSIWTPILEFLFRYGRFQIFIQVQPKSELINIDWSDLDVPFNRLHCPWICPDRLNRSLYIVLDSPVELIRVHLKIRNMLTQHGKLFRW